MEPKTKIEIIEETVAFYNNTGNRSLGEKGRCMYINGDKRCAFSRCCTLEAQEYLHKNCEGASVNIFTQSAIFPQLEGKINEHLLPEYRGHSVEFWIDIQILHDDIQNWNNQTLSKKGLEKVEKLKQEYK